MKSDLFGATTTIVMIEVLTDMMARRIYTILYIVSISNFRGKIYNKKSNCHVIMIQLSIINFFFLILVFKSKVDSSCWMNNITSWFMMPHSYKNRYTTSLKNAAFHWSCAAYHAVRVYFIFFHSFSFFTLRYGWTWADHSAGKFIPIFVQNLLLKVHRSLSIKKFTHTHGRT